MTVKRRAVNRTKTELISEFLLARTALFHLNPRSADLGKARRVSDTDVSLPAIKSKIERFSPTAYQLRNVWRESRSFGPTVLYYALVACEAVKGLPALCTQFVTV